VSGRIADALRRWTRKLFGPRHPTVKLLATLLLAITVFMFAYPATFRVSGDAVLEGASQRVSVAPFDGFIDEASVRAGDLVHQGQLLATLDDKDLRIDALRWESELARLQQQQRQALVSKERTEIALLEAQIRQTEAQLELSRLKLARTEIRAPVSGLVIAGDLSQKLGSPVQKGDTLFEIAPLDGYRVVLKVDERDVRFVRKGYPGRLLLSGMAGRSMPMTVTNVTAVSKAEDGLNFFRVEATLNDAAPAVRPGMEGVGKVDIDTRSLAWIWTRTFMNWLRVTWWEWTP
jgi:RND family efflux transporter MFP subunit